MILVLRALTSWWNAIECCWMAGRTRHLPREVTLVCLDCMPVRGGCGLACLPLFAACGQPVQQIAAGALKFGVNPLQLCSRVNERAMILLGLLLNGCVFGFEKSALQIMVPLQIP